MNNKPVLRHQADEQQDEYSIGTALDFTNAKDVTRQEFKDETDINRILGRFGLDTPVRTRPFSGDIDWDLDLQTALGAIQAAREMHARLPQHLKEKYPTYKEVLAAADDGTLKLDLDTPPPAPDLPPAPPTPTPEA